MEGGYLENQALIDSGPVDTGISDTGLLIMELEKPWQGLGDTQELINTLADRNEITRAELQKFQENNTVMISDRLRAYSSPLIETTQVSAELAEYFWIDQVDIQKIQEKLGIYELSLEGTMRMFQSKIEENLSWLTQEQRDKVILSIWKRIWNLRTNIEILQDENLEKVNVNNKWIINGKISEEFQFITDELFPSLEIYSQLQNGIEISEKYTKDDSIIVYDYRWNSHSIQRNKNYIDMNAVVEEIEELLDAEVDDKWNFKESILGILYTQNILNLHNSTHRDMINDSNIQIESISILSPDDLKIEQQAMLYFMAAIAVQCWIETLWGPVGSAIGWGLDLYDVFNSEDTLLQLVQKFGLVDENFKMEKTWIDNLLAGLGIVPWATQIIKWSKLAKFMSEVDPKVFDAAMQRVRNHLTWLKKFSEDDLVKFSEAESFLWRELKEIEKDAILEAHNFGERLADGKYSLADIRAKTEILEKAWFSKSERRILLKEWICGSLITDVSIEKILSIPGFDSLFDPQRGNIIREWVSREKLTDFIANNESLKSILTLYRQQHGRMINPDDFRSFIKEYNGLNSAEFDDVVWKLSKIYFKLLLFEVELSISNALKLLWWAPGSWKTTSLSVLGKGNTDEYAATFDSTLNDIRFVDYLIWEAANIGIQKIDIDIVHRKPELAWEWVVIRAMQENRPVELTYFMETYDKVVGVMNKLHQRGWVNLRLIENSGTRNDIQETTIEMINTIHSKWISREELVNITDRIINKEMEELIKDGLTGSELQKLNQLMELKFQLLK